MRTDSGDKTTRSRASKRRARTAPAPSAPSDRASFESLRVVANALGTAFQGYELCARRTDDAKVRVAVRSAAASLHALLDALVVEAARHGVDAKPRVRMADRLRWEWLASTGSMMDGAVDARILTECARLLVEVVGLDVRPLGDAIASRVRLASAEAWSLAAAVTSGARWHSERMGVAFLYST